MGLILDTSVIIASERRGDSIEDLLLTLRGVFGNDEIAISTITVVELTHGIYRARSPAERLRRQLFADDLFSEVISHSVTFEIASLAGKIDATLASTGISLSFEDLVIGATALYLGYAVVTLNLKHFKLIPELKVQTF